MSRGKQMAEEQAVPATAAGARLQQMRRRVRLTRLSVWAVMAAGPVALAVAVASPATVVRAAPATKPATVKTAVPGNPSGYASVFLTAWLRSRAGDESSAQARLAQSMAPNVDLPETSAAQPAPESVVAVRSAQQTGQSWSVTLAAQYADGRLRYFAVPVLTDRTGASFTVSGAPAVVASPARIEGPPSPYTVTVPTDGDLPSDVGEFLAAYLTGTGEVDRYLAPGVRLSPVSPAPYKTVTVEQLLAADEAAAAESVPTDGTRVGVMVQAEARDSGGRWPLAYELTLTARSGRWEVSALQSGTAQGGGAR
ncbi:conjugal transfer protein [Streptomyces sp. NBC_00124]|uniref:conjugal transfer protein n=1 Tax=Streptomyces sp. NBC_00124 TaxID=2975662 RepID=UPI002255697B|nr:conjugal transfer protein [Streptomyces sp. NBC_00124]MCX5357229.1 conjugal transfer protein [Streptomyces sp. NBC_00124]